MFITVTTSRRNAILLVSPIASFVFGFIGNASGFFADSPPYFLLQIRYMIGPVRIPTIPPT